MGGVLNIVFAFLDERNIFEAGAGWSARPSVVTWNLGGRTPENTSGFLHAGKEGKVGGFGSLMGSVSIPFAPGKQGSLGDAGGRGSKGEARNDIWSKDTSAARISGAFGGLVGSVGNSAGGFLGSMTKGAGLVTGMNPHVSGKQPYCSSFVFRFFYFQHENWRRILIGPTLYLPWGVY